MPRKQMFTKNGHDFFVVSSALQKAIRRNNPKLAGWAMLELFESNYVEYTWRRVMTISAEDCAGIITTEIEALYRAYKVVADYKAKQGKVSGLIFLSKAVLLLCAHDKNRDADHLIYLAKEKKLVTDEEASSFLTEVAANGIEDMPDYVYDTHTMRGRKLGKTREQFFREEMDALEPKTPGLFDDLMPGGPSSENP